MSLDGFLTLLGLIIAWYAVVPRHRQLELKLRWGLGAWVIVFLVLVVFHMLQFPELIHWLALTGCLDTLISIKPYIPENVSKLGAPKLSYMIILAGAILLFLYLATFKLSYRNLPAFKNLLEELISEKKYAEIFYLLEKYLTRLDEIYNKKYYLASLKLWLKNQHSQTRRWRGLLPGLPVQRFNLPENFSDRLSCLSNFFPNYEDRSNVASEILRKVVASDAIIDAMIEVKPYLGLKIVEKKFQISDVFLDKYIDKLMINKNSILYQEFNSSKNNTSNLIDIRKEDRILHFFMQDAQFTYDIAFYRPVAESVLKELDRLYRFSDLDTNLDAYDTPFEEAEQWRNQIQLGNYLFKMLLTRALYQGIEWHMWLYYLPMFVERMVRNYTTSETDPLADKTDEFPTRYHYLIYEVIDTLRDIVEALQKIPHTQANVQLASERADHENGNIPKSALLALGQCMGFVVSNPKIEQRFKRSMVDMVLRLYFELCKQSGENVNGRRYAQVLANSLRSKGFEMTNVDQNYINRLVALVDGYRTEAVVHNQLVEFNLLRDTLTG